MEYTEKNLNAATGLLQSLVRIPSYTFDEGQIADFLERFLLEKSVGISPGYNVRRIKNNLLLYSREYSPNRKTLLFCAHIDTVKESENYTFDPFCGTLSDGRILGLGSNDDKGAATAAIFAFLYYMELHGKMKINVALALCAEEERGGDNGITAVVKELDELGVKPDWAVVCEPTNLEAAVAERGLLVIDATATGISGHAAREEGVNALYIAMDDIARLRDFRFEKISPLMGKVRLSVTQISCGTAHNVIPDKCTYTIDIRPTELYDNAEIVELLSRTVKSDLKARNLKNKSSATPQGCLLSKWAETAGIRKVVSPTTSDWGKISFPAMKIGPGKSERSHKADEFITVGELKGGMEKYIEIIDFINERGK